jgi:hypothetical protein
VLACSSLRSRDTYEAFPNESRGSQLPPSLIDSCLMPRCGRRSRVPAGISFTSSLEALVECAGWRNELENRSLAVLQELAPLLAGRALMGLSRKTLKGAGAASEVKLRTSYDAPGRLLKATRQGKAIFRTAVG